MRTSFKLRLWLVALLATACTSPCLIDSSPQGADVYLDGEFVGTTPVSVALNRSQFVRSYGLKVALEGYEVVHREVERESALIQGSHWPSSIFIRLQKAQPK
jgi:hypothetical protein